MGARPPATTRANTSTSTEAAPPRSSVRAQPSPRREHVVDQHQFSPGNLGFAVSRHAESPLDVLRPFGLAETYLVWRGLDALEHAVGHHPAARLGDDFCQQSRLIEPAHPLPPPVQRNWNDGVGVREQFAPGARHPASHGRGEVKPVAVFQGVDELARDIVVAHGSPRAVIGRRIGDRLHGQHARSAVERERGAEPLAIGRRDEGELGPARRAQTRAVDRLATDGAKLRQCHIEDACKAGTQGGGNPPPTPGRNPARFHVPLHEIRLPPRRKELNARSSGEEPIRNRGRTWY
jgi:hypothetical protein